MHDAQLTDFPGDFRGETYRPADSGYQDARSIWNTLTSDATPALIARCADVADVVTAVRYASDRDLPFGIRSGGHAVDGTAMPDGALVVDLSRLKAIDVNPATGVVRVEAGVTLGELDAATQRHGLVVPSGTVTTTGVAGLALGGGIGFNSRSHGMTVDNMLACELVTVDGAVIRASAEEHADLFWGLCGAGHNFGVVTAFEFQAHPIGPEVYSGLIVFPLDQAEPVLTQLDAHLAGAPRSLAVDPVLLPAPPLPGLPEPVVGTPVLTFVVVYTGALDTAERVIGEVAGLGEPLANLVRPTSWLEANSLLDVLAPPGRRNFTRGGYIAGLTAPVIDTLVELISDLPAPDGPGVSAAIPIQTMGGAIDDVDEDATAFSRTGALWLWEALAQWDNPERDEEFMAFPERALAALRPHGLSNAYVNLSANQGPEWVRKLYGSPEKFQRLQALKAEWDPRNLLRFNKNIEPARAEARA